MGYVTEATMESIWDTAIVDARFTLLNKRIAEVLNYWLTDDATTDIATATVTPVLAALSEEIMIELMAAAKIEAVNNPWDFILARSSGVIARKIKENDFILDRIKKTLGKSKTIEIVTVGL